MSVHGQSTGLCLFDDRRKDLGRDHLVDLQEVDAGVGEARYICPGSLHIRVGNPEEGPVLPVVHDVLSVQQRAGEENSGRGGPVRTERLDHGQHSIQWPSSIADAGDSVA